MPRPRSDDRRAAILDAASRVIAADGLGASTAAIARAAGVSNGSLFVYFDTKSTLINELYVALKVEMATTAQMGLPTEIGPREALSHLWTRWLAWATEAPYKRRALAQLSVSEEITAPSHAAAAQAMAEVARILEAGRAGGPMRDVPLAFALTLVNAIAEAAIDAILIDPVTADARSNDAFEAIWRVLAGAADPTEPSSQEQT